MALSPPTQPKDESREPLKLLNLGPKDRTVPVYSDSPESRILPYDLADIFQRSGHSFIGVELVDCGRRQPFVGEHIRYNRK